jgi:hypothetical protein
MITTNTMNVLHGVPGVPVCANDELPGTFRLVVTANNSKAAS